jgi:hypothetical protein
MKNTMNLIHKQKMQVLNITGRGDLYRHTESRGKTIDCEIDNCKIISTGSNAGISVNQGIFPYSRDKADRFSTESVSSVPSTIVPLKVKTALNNKEANNQCSPLEPVLEEANLCR